MSRFESKGTWFEINDPDKYPRLKTITCPACQRASRTLEINSTPVRTSEYCESMDRHTRRINIAVRALCLCGASFEMEVSR
jgi:hypothetical protein